MGSIQLLCFFLNWRNSKARQSSLMGFVFDHHAILFVPTTQVHKIIRRHREYKDSVWWAKASVALSGIRGPRLPWSWSKRQQGSVASQTPCFFLLTMAMIPIVLVGYPISSESLEQYFILNNLPDDYRSLVANLQTKINTQVKLVSVDIVNVEGTTSNYYLCCFADSSGKPYEAQDLLDIPVPLAFNQLPQVIPVEGELRRMFAPKAFAFVSRVPVLVR